MALHCWADRFEEESKGMEYGSNEWAELWINTHESCGGTDGTCMLEAGHSGPHEWTADGNIAIAFKPVEANTHA